MRPATAAPLHFGFTQFQKGKFSSYPQIQPTMRWVICIFSMKAHLCPMYTWIRPFLCCYLFICLLLSFQSRIKSITAKNKTIILFASDVPSDLFVCFVLVSEKLHISLKMHFWLQIYDNLIDERWSNNDDHQKLRYLTVDPAKCFLINDKWICDFNFLSVFFLLRFLLSSLNLDEFIGVCSPVFDRRYSSYDS